VGDIGAVILAAGASRRLGTPKQLLLFEGRSLLRRTAEETLVGGCTPVVVVLGACLEPAARELSRLPVRVVENAAWSQGMGSSIRVGLEALCALPEAGRIEGLMLTVCDQPRYSAGLVARLIEAYRKEGRRLTACEYGGTRGVPALFPPSLFSDLRTLSGDEGARKLLRSDIPVVSVPFPAGAVEVDTLQNYARLLQASEGWDSSSFG
jgi:molybdenum cofactor cytidylyltransferase